MNKLLLALLVFITFFVKAQVPVMNTISGASLVCSSSSSPNTFSTSASNSPTSYSWSVIPSANVIITNPTNSSTPISFPYLSSNYTIYCSASNGFGTSVSSSSFGVSTISSPTITFSPLFPYVCIGSSTTVIASGANTYTWSNAATGNSLTVSPTIPTTYSVTGTNSLTGCASNSSVTISVQSLCSITAGSSNTTICTGQSTPASAGIANNFYWSSSPSSVITASTLNHNSVTTLSPINTTTYYVSATSMISPCPGTASFVINVLNCLGLKNLDANNNELKIYPNPADEIISIKSFILNDNEVYKITLYNNIGQLLKEEEIVFINQTATLNTEDLQNGVYNLKLKSDNSISFNKRLVVSR